MFDLDQSRWVPASVGNWQADTLALAAALKGERTCLLSGAGLSTASGIPDYRGPGTEQRARNPISYRNFVADDLGRRRYWSRAMLGWQRIAAAAPNPAHQAVTQLQRAGLVSFIITQNVDGLQQQSGARDVIELHGNLAEIICLDCGDQSARSRLQERLEAANPGWAARSFELGPDGDADTPTADLGDFEVQHCERCGGMLKPQVVFFGEAVDREVVVSAQRAVDACTALLVVGSSLTVFSGLRFVRQAHAQEIPIYIVNIGETRADALAQLKVSGELSQVLPLLVEQLSPPAGTSSTP